MMLSRPSKEPSCRGLQELCMLTDTARSRRGIGAVAPALEPYVDATHWPSGAPLPLCITARRCWRVPKVMTSPYTALRAMFLAAALGALQFTCMYGWVKPLQCPRWGLPAGARALVLVILCSVPFVPAYRLMVLSDSRMWQSTR